MRKLYIFVALLGLGQSLLGQQGKLNTSGTIEYERRINVYAIIRKMYDGKMQGTVEQVFEKYQENNPQFEVRKSALMFANGRTLFVPNPGEEASSTVFGRIPLTQQNNVIFTDLLSRISVTEKSLKQTKYLIKDTLSSIRWKITDETREIAGYECRRANGVILDSVYVVAFYTNDIQVSTGPESFTGLPGAILEVALPRDNMTWVATKVVLSGVHNYPITPPNGGLPISKRDLRLLVLPKYENNTNRKWARMNVLDALL